MTQRDLVSVVMPVYRCSPDYLRLSLASLLNQTHDTIEVIAVLDSSHEPRDSSLFEIIHEFRDDHRLKLIERKHEKGFCTALNTGIVKSRGSLIGRLDADDYSDSTRIEKQIESLKGSNLSLTGTWAHVINEQGVEIRRLQTPISGKAIRDKIMLHNPFIHSSILFLKRLVNDVGLFDETLEGAEDYDFYLRIISKGHSCANIPEYLTNLREASDSMTRGKAWRRTRHRYLLAKWRAIRKLGYTRGRDMLFATASVPSLLVSPELATFAKKAIGWYS